PRHPTGQRAHLVLVDVGGVANAALRRAARLRVLHAKAGEDLDPAIVHVDGKVDNNLPRGLAEDLPEPFVKIEFAGGEVEARGLRFPRINLLLKRDGCHNVSAPLDAAWSAKA